MTSRQEQRKRRAQQRKKELQMQRILFVVLIVALVIAGFMIRNTAKRRADAAMPQTETVSASGSASGFHELAIESADASVIRPTQKAPVDPVAEAVTAWIDSHSIEEKVAQMFFITPEQLTGVQLVMQAGDTTKTAYEQYPVGGIIYQAQNFSDEEQVKTMLSTMSEFAEETADVPVFLGINEEGGSISQFADNEAFSYKKVNTMRDIGGTADVKQAYQSGTTIGSYLQELGFNFDFAPSGDVLTDEDTSMSVDRSFGSDASMVSEMALSQIRGLKEKDIIPVIKHFPGHGGTVVNEQGYAQTDETLENLLSSNMVPFRDAVDDEVPFIMVSHIVCTQISDAPSTMSSEVTQDLLRNKLDYQGVIITDALTLNAIVTEYGADGAAVAAVSAGADMLLMPSDFTVAYQTLVQAVKNGTISEDQINDSVARILEVKYTYLTDLAQEDEE